MLVFQERMGKTILKQETLKSYTCLNMQKLREEHNAVLNSDKDNGTTETIEQLDKLHQILEDKIGDVMEIGEEQDMLREQPKSLRHTFNEERVKSEKGTKTIQVLQKDLK